MRGATAAGELVNLRLRKTGEWVRGGAVTALSAPIFGGEREFSHRGGAWRWLDLSTVTKAGAASGRTHIPRRLVRKNSAVGGRARWGAGGEASRSGEIGSAMEPGTKREFPQIQGDHRWGIAGRASGRWGGVC